jgi:hypothetical protein
MGSQMSKIECGQSTGFPNVDSELRSLVHRFRDLLTLRMHVLRCFTEQGIQVEGWMKGEFLAFLTEEKRTARILDFDREVLIGQGRKKADVALTLHESIARDRIWIELKHYLIGRQKGIDYNAFGYFNDPAAGIRSDIEKLFAVSSPHKYALVLTTAKPKLPDWDAAITGFNRKFRPCLRSLTDPKDFPEEFFLGLVSVANLLEPYERAQPNELRNESPLSHLEQGSAAVQPF